MSEQKSQRLQISDLEGVLLRHERRFDALERDVAELKKPAPAQPAHKDTCAIKTVGFPALCTCKPAQPVPPKDDGIEERAWKWFSEFGWVPWYLGVVADFARSELARQQKQHEIELMQVRLAECLNLRAMAHEPNFATRRIERLAEELAALQSQQEAKP